MTNTMESKMEQLEVNGHHSSSDNYVYVQPHGEAEGMAATVDIAATERWEKDLLHDPKNRLAIAALSGTNSQQVLLNRDVAIADSQNFNIKIELEGSPITNQRASGRCWLFAMTNVFRVAIMRRYNIKELELSQTYLFFWDKLEKANYFLEQIVETVDEPLEGRLLQCLLADPVADGGQFDMAANIVEKYGVVPQQRYPDAFSAGNTRTLNSLITTKLREDALILRDLVAKDKSQVAVTKQRMMREVHTILTLMLGPPPKPNEDFTWEFYDKDDKFVELTSTPLKFAGKFTSEEGMDVTKLFSLVNDPRNAYDSLLSVSRLGNVVGMRPIRYVNVDMGTMKAACIKMLKADIPIFFGSDVGKFSNRDKGILDPALFEYETCFNIKLGMSKAQRLMAGESQMTHAMVLTAVHVDKNDRPVRWRVQNSWGDGSGTKGWFVMSDSWMDQFVYQAVVDPKFVSEDIHKVLEKEPLMLDPWDPLGSLA